MSTKEKFRPSAQPRANKGVIHIKLESDEPNIGTSWKKVTLNRAEIVNSRKETYSIKFGSVVVESFEANPVQTSINIKSGQLALERAKGALVKKGVSIETKKGVPLFRADQHSPNKLIRTLDGKEDVGTFVNGVFMVE
ncbi:hypothetical protein [Chitinimonas taiwanensis]|uniref:hypothetical protein n=1 Tax=Chitinimonas taiwanensis TaxID=240412 RepID=UPI0035B2332C